MKKKKLQCSVPTLLLAGVLCLTLAACGAKQSSDMLASDTDSAASAALPVKAMNAKRVDEIPIWQRATPTFTTTATIPTLRMKSCRLASIRRSMFPMKKPTRTLCSPLTGVTSDSWDTPAGHRVYDACRGFSVSWVCRDSGASSASSTSC